MFLSAQSFADLKGKGLICEVPTALHSFMKWTAYVFDKNKVERFMIAKKEDKFKLHSSGITDYNTDNEFIYMNTFTSKVNRKNLGYFTYHPKTPKYDTNVGECIVYKSKKKLIKQMKVYIKEEQRIYNKSLEGNKI